MENQSLKIFNFYHHTVTLKLYNNTQGSIIVKKVYLKTLYPILSTLRYQLGVAISVKKKSQTTDDQGFGWNARERWASQGYTLSEKYRKMTEKGRMDELVSEQERIKTSGKHINLFFTFILQNILKIFLRLLNLSQSQVKGTENSLVSHWGWNRLGLQGLSEEQDSASRAEGAHSRQRGTEGPSGEASTEGCDENLGLTPGLSPGPGFDPHSFACSCQIPNIPMIHCFM